MRETDECVMCECTGRVTIVREDANGEQYDGSAECPDCLDRYLLALHRWWVGEGDHP